MAVTSSSLYPLALCGALNTGVSLGSPMDTKDLHELFYAFWDAGVMLSFGRDCVTNIPKDSDPDDTGWHLMFPDMNMFKGKMDIFNRIAKERGLEVKQETHLGRVYTSIYRPGYRVSLDRPRPPMGMRTT